MDRSVSPLRILVTLAPLAMVAAAVRLSDGLPALVAFALATILVVGRDRRAFRRETMLRSASVTDPLTGLLNRRGLAEEVAANAGTPSALLFVDLDRFKAVNDALGHAGGDDLLVRVAGALAGPNRLAARVGGDEFAVILCGIAPGDVAEAVDDIRLAIQAAVPIAAPGAGLTASVGAVAYPDGLTDLPRALARAGAGLAAAKRAGRDRSVVEVAGAA